MSGIVKLQEHILVCSGAEAVAACRMLCRKLICSCAQVDNEVVCIVHSDRSSSLAMYAATHLAMLSFTAVQSPTRLGTYFSNKAHPACSAL